MTQNKDENDQVKITRLVAFDPQKPNQECIDLLREALKRAKAGEVHGVAISLAVYDPNTDSLRSSMNISAWEMNYEDTLYAGVAAMNFSLMHDRYNKGHSIEKLPLGDDDE